MPYIVQEKRAEISPHIKPLQDYIATAGELASGDLNYILTLLIIAYYKRRSNYQSVNDISGALDECGKEFDRRVTAKYEDKKIEQNGDVYDI